MTGEILIDDTALAEIAEIAGMSEETVLQGLQELEAHGCLEREQVEPGLDRYRLIFPSESR